MGLGQSRAVFPVSGVAVKYRQASGAERRTARIIGRAARPYTRPLATRHRTGASDGSRMEFVDYYEIMGLAPEATAEEIKRTYRKLARKYHPDVSDESDAEARFKAIGEAYAVLKDSERRAEYDALRELRARGGGREAAGEGFRPPPGGGDRERAGGTWRAWQGDDSVDFSDFFREAFGEAAARGGARGGPTGGRQGGSGFGGGAGVRMAGEDVHSRLTISLQDAYDGATLPLSLRSPIPREDGSLDIEERTLEVRIPVGVSDGQRIRLRGQGGPGIGGGPAGDLYIELAIAEDPRFALDGRDVTVVLPVSPWEAALGATVAVPTLGGEVRLTVPPRSSGGRRLRLKGRGLAGEPPGDQFVVLRVELPQPKTDEQKALFEEMARLWPDHDPRGGGRST